MGAAYLIAMAVFMIFLSVLFRYELVAPAGEYPIIFKLDRWTGDVDMILNSKSHRIDSE